ncbi:MAG: hypothetical protein ABII79_06565 [bacterium]
MTAEPDDFFDGSLFDPVTLGLHVPPSVLTGGGDTTRSDLAKDELLLHDSGVFVHELTHYLQFHGSWFGYYCLFHSQLKTHFFLKFLRHLCQTKRLVPPVAYHYPIDTDRVSDFIAQEDDQSIFLRMLNAERYFQEELYGWNYPYLSMHPLYEDSRWVKQSSVLYLGVQGVCLQTKWTIEHQELSRVPAEGNDIAAGPKPPTVFTSDSDRATIHAGFTKSPKVWFHIPFLVILQGLMGRE